MAVHRFPPFEFDPATLQLWKNGHPVKLQRKPALVLAALLENHGEPLARPEICARLWPAGTFVDFELSLNVAVKKFAILSMILPINRNSYRPSPGRDTASSVDVIPFFSPSRP